MARNTRSQAWRMGDKCLSCGLTGQAALSMASLDRAHDGCQGVHGRRHHFPQYKEPQ